MRSSFASWSMPDELNAGGIPSAATPQGNADHRQTGQAPWRLEMRRARGGERGRGGGGRGGHDERAKPSNNSAVCRRNSVPGLRRHVVHGRDGQSFVQQRGDHRPVVHAMDCEPEVIGGASTAMIAGASSRHRQRSAAGRASDLLPGSAPFPTPLALPAAPPRRPPPARGVQKPKPRRTPGPQRPQPGHAPETIQEQGQITDLAGHRPDMIQAWRSPARCPRYSACRRSACRSPRRSTSMAGPAGRRLRAEGPQAHAHGQGRGRPAAVHLLRH